MREIKFRAWDSNNQEMIEWEIVKDEMSMDWLDDYDLKFMQYTGLKDKNGKEIYEGDIVKTVYKTGYVEYCEKQARYNIYLKSKYRLNEMNFMKNMADECEALGNIYENPELLQGE